MSNKNVKVIPYEEIFLDFGRFMKKTLEIENKKIKPIISSPNPQEKTLQQKYDEKYGEKWVNRTRYSR